MSNGRWPLPDTWTWVRSADIANIVGGGTPKADDVRNFSQDGIKWVTPADLTGYSDVYIRGGRRDLSERGLSSSGATLLPKGTVLFSSRAPVGYCAIAANEISTNQGFKSLILEGEILPEFVRHYLLGAKDYAESLASGTTFLELSGKRMAELQIPLAPLPEQRRIVRKLDTLSARTTTARTHLSAITKLVEKYRQAVRDKAFSGELTSQLRDGFDVSEAGNDLLERIRLEKLEFWMEAERAKKLARGQQASDATIRKRYKPPFAITQEEGPFGLPASWAWAVADEIVQPGADIVYGIVQPGPKLDEGIPYVRGMDIVNGVIQTDQLLKTSPEIAKKYERASLKAGDILLGIIRATKVAIVPASIEGANITQGTARFRPSNVTSTDYLAHWLASKRAQSWLHSKYRGIDMPGLNLRDVRQLPVPLAPIEEQREIVRQIEIAFAKIDQLAFEAAKALKLIDRLDQRILAKAFAGELVPQDPTDEPANVSLERIRAERASNPKPKRGRRKKADA